MWKAYNPLGKPFQNCKWAHIIVVAKDSLEIQYSWAGFGSYKNHHEGTEKITPNNLEDTCCIRETGFLWLWFIQMQFIDILFVESSPQKIIKLLFLKLLLCFY